MDEKITDGFTHRSIEEVRNIIYWWVQRFGAIKKVQMCKAVGVHPRKFERALYSLLKEHAVFTIHNREYISLYPAQFIPKGALSERQWVAIETILHYADYLDPLSVTAGDGEVTHGSFIIATPKSQKVYTVSVFEEHQRMNVSLIQPLPDVINIVVIRSSNPNILKYIPWRSDGNYIAAIEQAGEIQFQ